MRSLSFIVFAGALATSVMAGSDDLVSIPAGTFTMGNAIAGEGSSDELPAHAVTLAAYRIGRTEVTWSLWREVRDWAVGHGYPDLAGKGFGQADDHPVVSVSWFDVVQWCNARSEYEGLTPVYTTTATQDAVYRSGLVDLTSAEVRTGADGYRLPTEAEWERAARGGISGRRFAWGDTIDHSLADYFSSSADTFDTNSLRDRPNPAHTGAGYPFTAPVTAYPENAYGLRDTAGNAREWCWDRYSSSYYASSPASAPVGPATGLQRVLRGGAWDDTGADARVARRDADRADSPLHGFRVAQSLPAADTAPVITQSPVDASVSSGATVTLNVVATGSGPLAYAWTHDDTVLPDQTQAQLVLTGVAAADSGVYRAIVTNAAGSTTSDGAIVSVDGYSTFQSWALGLGLSPAAPLDDPDHDGHDNLVEYALGLDPESPDTLAWPALRFATGDELGLTGDDRLYTVIEVPINPLALGVTVGVEMTATLPGWTDFPDATTFQSDTLRDGRTWRFFRTVQPCGPEDAPRFFRVRVED